MMTIASPSMPSSPPPPSNGTAVPPTLPKMPLSPPRSQIGEERDRRRRAAPSPETSSSCLSSSSPSSSSGDDDPSCSSSLSSSALDRQLSLILILRCLRSSNLSSPISVPFLSSLHHGVGLSPAEILWLGSAYSLFTVVAEMPSGYLSDVWGRRRTLKMAFASLSGSLALLSFCRSESISPGQGWLVSLLGTSWHRKWALLLLSQLLRAIGSALFSGTDMALLFETLKRHGGKKNDVVENSSSGNESRLDDPKNGKSGISSSENKDSVKERVLAIESRHVFSSAVAEASSSALGGMLAASWALGLRGTVLASAVPFGFGAVACTMLEDDCPKKAQQKAENKALDATGESEGNGSEKEEDNESQGDSSSSSRKPQPQPQPARSESALRQLHRASSSLLLPGEPGSPLRRVFPVGVAINCATYVSSTALLPLLWSGAGLPASSFGWIMGANRAVSAASSLSAPALKRLMVSGSSGLMAEDAKDIAMGRSLTVLVITSAVSFGMMAVSASLIPDEDATISPSSTLRAMIPAALAVFSSVLLSAIRGLAWPLLGAAINGSVKDDSLRATTLSLFAGSIKAGMVATGFVLGMVLEVEQAAGAKADDAMSKAAPGLRDACILCGALLTVLAAFSGGLTARLAGAFPSRVRRVPGLGPASVDGNASQKKDD